MKIRPQVQFRFRDVEQFDRVKELAKEAGESVNEYILMALEEKACSPQATAKPDVPTRTTHTKKMTVEQFQALPNSEQQRARREGRY